MVNHARTILLNEYPDKLSNIALGANYIDHTFKPIKELDSVIKVKNTLFGTDPDQLTYNLMAVEYMNLIRSDVTGLAYIKSLDKRLIDEYKGWAQFDIGSSFTHLVPGNLDFNLIGNFVGDDYLGHNIGKVKLKFNSSNLNTCVIHD